MNTNLFHVKSEQNRVKPREFASIRVHSWFFSFRFEIVTTGTEAHFARQRPSSRNPAIELGTGRPPRGIVGPP
jgi:hypothetical protein